MSVLYELSNLAAYVRMGGEKKKEEEEKINI